MIYWFKQNLIEIRCLFFHKTLLKAFRNEFLNGYYECKKCKTKWKL